MRNSDWHAIGIFAVLACGAVYTGCTHLNPLREIRNTIADSEATYIIAEMENINLVLKAKEHFPGIKQVLTCFDELEGFQSLKSLCEEGGDLGEQEEAYAMEIDTTEELAIIHFSSGTTGQPKPIIRTHANCLYFAAINQLKWFPASRLDRVVCLSPFCHGAGFTTLILTLEAGATLVPYPESFEAEHFLEFVQNFQVRGFFKSLCGIFLRQTICVTLSFNCSL